MRKLTRAERAELRNKFAGRCAYCGDELGERWHADHVNAVHRNPAGHVRGECEKPHNDRLENMMPACPPCNISKATFPLEEWRKVLAGYVGALHRNAPTYRLAKKHGLIVETDRPVVFHFETLEVSA